MRERKEKEDVEQATNLCRENLCKEKHFNTDKWKWHVKISYFHIYTYKRTIQ